MYGKGKGSKNCGAAHGSKGGSKARPGSHGPSQQSSSDKEASSMVKKCGPTR